MTGPETVDEASHSKLTNVDPEMFKLVAAELGRQVESIELIASENFTSDAVLQVLGSCLTNKYSEGYPGKRYYGGNEIVDEIEKLCIKRALEAFDLDASEWGVNVQPYSGSPANLAVYMALLKPHDRIMGLELASGGHLSHGFYTPAKRLTASSIFFESLPYKVHKDTGLIDFEHLRETANMFQPKLIVCGFSSYPRAVDWERFRTIANEVGAILMCDIAHISGLVASGLHPSPFPHADVVTTTTHKTLRGPRSGVIFYNKAKHPDYTQKIDGSVFPGIQGGPHNNVIGALAVQLRELQSQEFKDYCTNVVNNAHVLADHLKKRGHKLVAGGTDTHLILWDLSPHKITGSKMEKICELTNVSLNKNSVPGDKSALSPNGVRIGTAAMTTRGCLAEDWERIADLLDRILRISLEIQAKSGPKLVDFTAAASADERVSKIREEVVGYGRSLHHPQKSLYLQSC